MELINEILFQNIFYVLMLTVLSTQPLVNYKIGWFTFALIFTLIAVNIINIMVDSIPKFVATLKKKYVEFKQKINKRKERKDSLAKLDE